MTEDAILVFAASSVTSIWALESLLLLKQAPLRAWEADELVRQLRGSHAAISEALTRLRGAGIVTEADGRYRYHPQSAEQDALVNELEKLYCLKPVTVISAIANAPNRKLRILSDAFKIKKD